MAVEEAVHVITVLLCLVAAAGCATFHCLSWFQQGVDYGIFSRPEDVIWKKYESDILEVDWLFYVWMVVYGVQAPWLLYSLVAPCYRTKGGNFGVKPSILPISIYVCFFISVLGYMGWWVMWNIYHDDYSRYALVCMSASAIATCVAVCASVSVLRLYSEALSDQGFSSHLAWIKFSMHNGLGLFGGWALIVVLINMGLILTDGEILGAEKSSYMVFGVLMGYMVVLMLLDLLVAGKMLSSMVSPYLIGLFVYVMYLYKSRDDTKTTMFTVVAVFAALIGLLVVAKVMFNIARHCACTADDGSSIISTKKYDPELQSQQGAAAYGAVAYENNSGPSSEKGDNDSNADDELWTY